MNTGLTSHQHISHTETEPRFKVSSERPEKQESKVVIPKLRSVRLDRVGMP